jgi:hypothetical protein
LLDLVASAFCTDLLAYGEVLVLDGFALSLVLCQLTANLLHLQEKQAAQQPRQHSKGSSADAQRACQQHSAATANYLLCTTQNAALCLIATSLHLVHNRRPLTAQTAAALQLPQSSMDALGQQTHKQETMLRTVVRCAHNLPVL